MSYTVQKDWKIYCKRTNSMYWLLGYFCGAASINLGKFIEVAEAFGKEYNVDSNDVIRYLQVV